MEFDTIGNGLIVADAYYGIWFLDLDTGKKTQLVSPTEELDGKVETTVYFFRYSIGIGTQSVLHTFPRRFVVQRKYSTRLLFRNPVTFIGRIHRPISYSKTAFSLYSPIHPAVYSNTIARRNRTKRSSMKSTLPMALRSVRTKISFWSPNWLHHVCCAII